MGGGGGGGSGFAAGTVFVCLSVRPSVRASVSWRGRSRHPKCHVQAPQSSLSKGL